MRAYSEMKDSGIEWLGKLPGDWSVRRVGSLFKHRNEKVSDKDFEPLSVTKKGIVPQLEDAAKTNDGDNRKKVLKGDFVINSRSDRKGSSGVSPLDGSVSLINTVLSQGKLDSRYTHHLLRSQPFQEEFYRYGQGIVADLWSTNYSRMKAIALPVPPKPIQQKIADFLDTETAQIDNLIAKQEQLLELLEEKRRATITHAVTRGLNPSVELKETNIPWLGQIPVHWRLEKIKYIANRRDEKIATASGQKYIGLEHVESFTGKEISAEAQSEPEGLSLGYQQGDVLFGKLRPYLAKVIKATDSGICSSEFVVLSAEDKTLPEFLKYSLLNNQFIEEINSSTYGAKMPRANWDYIGNSYLPVPSIEEQENIAHFIGQQDRVVTKLKQKIQTQITLLRERRTSLISHVVTGKVMI